MRDKCGVLIRVIFFVCDNSTPIQAQEKLKTSNFVDFCIFNDVLKLNCHEAAVAKVKGSFIKT